MVQNDGSLFPKIDFCVEGDHTSFGLDEIGQEIQGNTYLFPRGTHRNRNGASPAKSSYQYLDTLEMYQNVYFVA